MKHHHNRPQRAQHYNKHDTPHTQQQPRHAAFTTTSYTQLTTTLKPLSLLCSSNARRELSHGRETYSTPPGTSPWPWLLTHYT